jgi:predicted DNA-binding transcriptional regulator AlpA
MMHRPRLKRSPHYHLDRRADQIADASAGPPDQLIDSKALAAWLGVSEQWVEIARSKGHGPEFVKLGPRRVRYRRASVLAWLEERTRQATGEES